MAGRVTIKSIAQDLGISHMTVSRALSGHPNVQSETREAVKTRARELGYVRNAAASAMRGDATSIVGLLLPNIVNEFYARFANAMALACDANSLQLLIHLTNDDIEIERQSLERLREVQARAVVLVPAPGDFDPQKSNLETMQVIQLIRQRQTEANSAALLVDDHGAIQDAVVFLAKAGHSAIAYIGADAALSSGRERLAAFRQGLEVAGIPVNMDLIHTDTPSFEMGRAATEKLLDRTSASALVCGGFEISNGSLSALMIRNQKPNGTFAFVGYGDPSFYSWIDGGLSTIRVPVESLASRAAELVAACTDTQNSQPLCTERYSAELIIRGGAQKLGITHGR